MAICLNNLLILLKLRQFCHWPDQNLTAVCLRASANFTACKVDFLSSSKSKGIGGGDKMGHLK